MLLNKKWIEPVLNGLHEIPNTIVENFIKKIQAMEEKYATTFADIEKEIRETEKELIGFIDELTGSDADMKGLMELKLLLGGE